MAGMTSLFWKIKRLLTNKKSLVEYFTMELNKSKSSMAWCLGVNKEGVRCPRATSCKRYTEKTIVAQEYIEFPENYNIKECEVFTDVNFKSND